VMSVVGPIAAKKLQGRECSEVFSLQQNSLVIRSRDISCHSHLENAISRNGRLWNVRWLIVTPA
jgi:hypothetical protein